MPPSPAESISRRASARPPWTRLLLALAVCGPALAIGGVPPWVVPWFCLIVAALWWRLCGRSEHPVRIPVVVAVGATLAVLTLIQWVPLPGLRELLAPGLQAQVVEALQGSGVDPPPGLSVTRADTALEAARLIGLTFLAAAAAQLSWRTCAALVAGVATVVAIVGLGQGLLGIDAIYGVYPPRDLPGPRPALMGTFVNPNHQSGLLLLGIFCAGALARELHRRRMSTRDPHRYDAHGDWMYAALAATLIQVAALLLSLSRAAMLAGLLLGPAALMLGLRRRADAHSDRGRRRRRRSPARLLIAGGFVVTVLVIGQHEAWSELRTLLDLTQEEPKYRMAVEGLQLVELSPVVGIGRGGFIDLYPLVDSRPGTVIYTHLESTPAAMVLEWGPVVGLAALLSLGAWWVWAFSSAGRREDARGRRIALLGLLALALQSIGDFSLEFLGVAAPACALAGALSPRRAFTLAPGPCRWGGLSALIAAVLLAAAAYPQTWSMRAEGNEAILEGTLSAQQVLSQRPLDGRAHAVLARRAANAGDWERAHARARVATRRFPGSMDGWLVLGAAQLELGETREGRASTRTALELMSSPIDVSLSSYLLGKFPRPEDLVEVMPEGRAPFALLIQAFRDRAPEHAEALAAARTRTHPSDPLPLRYRSEMARRRGRPALALHHARLYRQLAPNEALSHLTVAAAFNAFSPPRRDDAIAALEQALADDDLSDPAERALVEETLVRQLLRNDDAASRTRAVEVAEALTRRPSRNRKDRQRREQLLSQARAALESDDED